MTAFFFGPEAQRLYGYHHAPSGHSSRGVVICPPWGSEYQFAHRSLLLLARRLAGAGLHVLRFDYSCTGDSWGRSTDAELERWTGDTILAVDELRAVAGVEDIDLLGLRLGSVVALRTAALRRDVDRLVLWDPIVDGDRWIEEVGGVRRGRTPGIEIDRAAVSSAFVDQLAAVSQSDFDNVPAGRTLVLATGPGAIAEYESAGTFFGHDRVERQRLDQPSPWIEDQSIWAGKVPMQSVQAIVEWLA